MIEIVASLVVIWHLKNVRREQRERFALRVIAVAFGLLAIYITVQIPITVSTGSHPGASQTGVVWLALTIAAMFALAAGKRVTGIRLGNTVLQTEARVTLIDGLLAAAILAGVALNATLGLWLADQASAMVIVYYGARESRIAWREAA